MATIFSNAGHIPGAGMLKVETDNKNILFTGDFDTRDSPLTNGAKPHDVDMLFIEGTYGVEIMLINNKNLTDSLKM